MNKKCPNCGAVKPEDDFYLLKTGKRDSWCKECRKVHQQKYKGRKSAYMKKSSANPPKRINP